MTWVTISYKEWLKVSPSLTLDKESDRNGLDYTHTSGEKYRTVWGENRDTTYQVLRKGRQEDTTMIKLKDTLPGQAFFLKGERGIRKIVPGKTKEIDGKQHLYVALLVNGTLDETRGRYADPDETVGEDDPGV